MIIQIVPITYPGLGVATKARVFAQSYEFEDLNPVPCNVRLFNAEDVEIINIPSSVERKDFDGKTGTQVVDVVFEKLSIQRK